MWALRVCMIVHWAPNVCCANAFIHCCDIAPCYCAVNWSVCVNNSMTALLLKSFFLCPSVCLSVCPWTGDPRLRHKNTRGATTAEKLRGPRFESQHQGACAPRLVKGRAGCWVREGVAPPAVRVLGYHPRKVLKTQMLNPAFWYYLLWKFLLFENYGQEVGEDQYIVGRPVSPGTYGCLSYEKH